MTLFIAAAFGLKISFDLIEKLLLHQVELLHLASIVRSSIPKYAVLVAEFPKYQRLKLSSSSTQLISSQPFPVWLLFAIPSMATTVVPVPSLEEAPTRPFRTCQFIVSISLNLSLCSFEVPNSYIIKISSNFSP